jgi:hypothetical protein
MLEAIKLVGANAYKYIRLKNPGPADVFILGVRAYPSKVYSIAKDHSTEAIVGAASFIRSSADARRCRLTRRPPRGQPSSGGLSAAGTTSP